MLSGLAHLDSAWEHLPANCDGLKGPQPSVRSNPIAEVACEYWGVGMLFYSASY